MICPYLVVSIGYYQAWLKCQGGAIHRNKCGCVDSPPVVRHHIHGILVAERAVGTVRGFLPYRLVMGRIWRCLCSSF
jgi:hypothetical protein